ncbi:unnamed protein product, partial [Allacma fusca]
VCRPHSNCHCCGAPGRLSSSFPHSRPCCGQSLNLEGDKVTKWD